MPCTASSAQGCQGQFWGTQLSLRILKQKTILGCFHYS